MNHYASPVFVTKSLDAAHGFLVSKQGAYQPGTSPPDAVAGHCVVCGSSSLFLVDRLMSDFNWRETLHCVGCDLFARWRACLHLLESLDAPPESAAVYLTEATSSFFDAVKARYPQTIGSEYSPEHPLGQQFELEGRIIRNEDVTRLTFEDGAFSLVICQDVLEHVPDFPAALREFCRVLRPGGSLYLTVPFAFTEETLVRAELDEEGELVHHLPPMYHLDPTNPDGVLCFQDFGMDLLDHLRDAGFDDAVLVGVRDPRWGYVGGDVIFRATRNP